MCKLTSRSQPVPPLFSVLVVMAALPGCYLAHGAGDEGDDEPAAVATARHAQLALGSEHACVLLGDGAVHCWGSNAFGQLGLGSPGGPSDDQHPPVRVADLPAIRQISASGALTCALDRGGRVHCWGLNAHGQLGIGLNAAPDRCVAPGYEHNDCAGRPLEVEGLEDIVQVSAGDLHACALRADGRVLCWGFIALDLRDAAQAPPPATGAAPGTSSDYSIVGTPVPMLGVAAAVQLAVGASSFGPGHTCAVLADGSVQCWGNRTFGQTGPVDMGLDARDPLPAELTRFALGGAAVHVAAGSSHSCAVTAQGEVFCWGLNSQRQLGARDEDVDCVDGAASCMPSSTVRTPVRATGVERAIAVAIHGRSPGDEQTCALLADRTVTCWHGGRLVPVPGLRDVVELAGNCATVRDGRVLCWQAHAAPAQVAEVELAASSR